MNYAGGFLPWANLKDVNLDFSLKDDEEIRIPEGKLDINQASAKELAELPGIGPVLAARIIKYRERKGTFQSFSQVLEVKGIGEVRLQRIREIISLDEEEKGGVKSSLSKLKAEGNSLSGSQFPIRNISIVKTYLALMNT